MWVMLNWRPQNPPFRLDLIVLLIIGHVLSQPPPPQPPQFQFPQPGQFISPPPQKPPRTTGFPNQDSQPLPAFPPQSQPPFTNDQVQPGVLNGSSFSGSRMSAPLQLSSVANLGIGVNPQGLSLFRVWDLMSRFLPTVQPHSSDYILSLQPQLLRGLPTLNMSMALVEPVNPQILRLLVGQATSGMLVSQSSVLAGKLVSRLGDTNVIHMILGTENPAQLFGFFNPRVISKNLAVLIRSLNEFTSTRTELNLAKVRLLPTNLLSMLLNALAPGSQISLQALSGSRNLGNANLMTLSLLGTHCSQIKALGHADVIPFLDLLRSQLVSARKLFKNFNFPINLRNCGFEAIINHLKMKSGESNGTNLLNRLDANEIGAIGGEFFTAVPVEGLENLPLEIRREILIEIGHTATFDLLVLASNSQLKWYGDMLLGDLIENLSSVSTPSSVLPGLKSSPSGIDTHDLLKLGNLFCYGNIGKVNATKDALRQWLSTKVTPGARACCWDSTTQVTWAAALKKIFGADTSSWKTEDLAIMGDLMVALPPMEIAKISLNELSRVLTPILEGSGLNFPMRIRGNREVMPFARACVNLLEEPLEYLASFKALMRRYVLAAELMVNSLQTAQKVIDNNRLNSRRFVRDTSFQQHYAHQTPYTPTHHQAASYQGKYRPRPESKPISHGQPLTFQKTDRTHEHLNANPRYHQPLPTFQKKHHTHQNSKSVPRHHQPAPSFHEKYRPRQDSSRSQNYHRLVPSHEEYYFHENRRPSPMYRHRLRQSGKPLKRYRRQAPPMGPPPGQFPQNNRPQPMNAPKFMNTPPMPMMRPPTDSSRLPPTDAQMRRPSLPAVPITKPPTAPFVPGPQVPQGTFPGVQGQRFQQANPNGPQPTPMQTPTGQQIRPGMPQQLPNQPLPDPKAKPSETLPTAPGTARNIDERPRSLPNERRHSQITCLGIRAAGPAGIGLKMKDFESLETSELMDCIEDIGLIDWGEETKRQLLGIYKSKLNLTSDRLSTLNLLELGTLVTGISGSGSSGKGTGGIFGDGDVTGNHDKWKPFDIASIDLSVPNNLDSIAILGSRIRDTEMLKAIGDKFSQDNGLFNPQTGRSRSSFVRATVWSLGNILCGLDDIVLKTIFNSAPSLFLELSPLLGRLEGCGPETLSTLLAYALQPGSYGSPDTWTQEDVNTIGVFVAGLPPESLVQIPPQAMPGLHYSAVQAFSTQQLQSLTPDQLSNFSYSAASHIDHSSALSGEQVRALSGVLFVNRGGFNISSDTEPSMRTPDNAPDANAPADPILPRSVEDIDTVNYPGSINNTNDTSKSFSPISDEDDVIVILAEPNDLNSSNPGLELESRSIMNVTSTNTHDHHVHMNESTMIMTTTTTPKPDGDVDATMDKISPEKEAGDAQSSAPFTGVQAYWTVLVFSIIILVLIE